MGTLLLGKIPLSTHVHKIIHVYMCTCAHRPGCEVVVHFFSGTGPTQSKVHLAIKVEDVVGRNPEDSLQVERVQLLK